MEHLSKFMQIGPSNAVLTQIRFIQPNADWMSAERLRAVEAELSSVIEKRLPDILSLKPGAIESVNGDLTHGDIKVTYNMKKRPNTYSFVLRPRADNHKWDAKRAKLAEESSSKFRDYGGMFQRKTVLKSELTVSMRRLTASELAQQAKVQNAKTSESSKRGISGYFKPAAVPRPKTPEEKAALKRLLDRRETKKRRISSSDSESNSASENLCEDFKSSKHHDRRLKPSAHSDKLKNSKAEENTQKFTSLSQPLLEKHTSQATARPEARISATQSCKLAESSRGSSPSVQSGWNRQDRPNPPKESSGPPSRGSSPSVQSGWNRQDRPNPPKESSGPPVQSGWNRQDRPEPSKESSKSKPSSHRDKEKAKSHDLGSSARSSSSSSRNKEYKARSEHKEPRERDSSHNRKTEMEKESSSKSSRSGKEKELAQEGSRHRDKRHSPTRKLRKEEKSSSSKRTHESRDREEKPKAPKPKVANIKQLLTDCGISDSDDSDKGTSEKKHRDEASRRSPDSTQLVDVRPIPHTSKRDGAAKRESLDDFQSKKETSRAMSMASNRQKEPDNTLCKSLFLDDEESDDGEGKNRQECSKSPTTEDYTPAVNMLKKALPRLPETDVYEPTPVAKLATEDDAEERPSSKPAASIAGFDEEVSKLMSTPPHRDSYVPSYRQTPTRSEAFSYNPASPKRQDDKRRKKDAGHIYIPSSVGPSSAARPSRGRYEEYVPEAVSRTARHQQSTVDYVPTYIPTPKREINPDVSTTTYSMQQHDNRNTAAEGFVSGTLDQEIRNARCVKDLDMKHVLYLFQRTLPILDKIGKREVESWRFDDFLKGGRAKRELTHKVYIHKFSHEQVDYILKLFLEEFAHGRWTDGDFIHQVLYPEFLIRVFMANQGTTCEQSEKLMAEDR